MHRRFQLSVCFSATQWHSASNVAVLKAQIYILGREGQKRLRANVKSWKFTEIKKKVFFFLISFLEELQARSSINKKLRDRTGTSLPWPPISFSPQRHMDGRCSSMNAGPWRRLFPLLCLSLEWKFHLNCKRISGHFLHLSLSAELTVTSQGSTQHMGHLGGMSITRERLLSQCCCVFNHAKSFRLPHFSDKPHWFLKHWNMKDVVFSLDFSEEEVVFYLVFTVCTISRCRELLKCPPLS